MKKEKCERKRNSSQGKNKNLALVIIGIVLCSLHWPVAGAALIVYGVFRSTRSGGYRSPSPRARDILRDAEARGLAIPNDPDLWQMLRRLYRRHHSSCAGMPNLKPEFDQIIEEVWNGLALTDDVIQWKLTVQEALRDWPVAGGNTSERLKDALKKAKQAAADWQEARNEAWRTDS
jgi:hypothetical protein